MREREDAKRLIRLSSGGSDGFFDQVPKEWTGFVFLDAGAKEGVEQGKGKKDDGRFRSDEKKHSGKREELKASLEACRNRGPC